MQIYNTLGRREEPFETRDGGRVGMYVCGPTVQSAPHLGHGRSAVAFDVMRRYLEYRGFDVTYVVNVTDVEDKIIAAAAERGVTPEEVADEVGAQFREAYDGLGVRRPDIEPKATEHIPEMIELIEDLITAGHAYAAPNGDVYFGVRSFDRYGQLSGRNIDELIAGARVEPDEDKRDPLDFALWKAAKPGEPHWPSPWGEGRPGWHIECSAMARKYLGSGFDIHGGGTDLIFPHHENEIAQAEAAYGAPFARYWLHNGMLNLGGEKMAKSTGRVVDLLGALAAYPPMALRLFFLRTHYRKPLDFTEEALEDAKAALERLWSFRRRFPGEPQSGARGDAVRQFDEHMEQDFDTAGALAVLFEVVREGNGVLDAGEDAGSHVATFDAIAGVLGLAEPAMELTEVSGAIADLLSRWGGEPSGDPDTDLARLVELRTRARDDQDWALSDDVRDALAALGIALEDSADGTRWHRL